MATTQWREPTGEDPAGHRVYKRSKSPYERFMDERHRAMWEVVSEPEEVPAAIEAAVSWSHEARGFATL